VRIALTISVHEWVGFTTLVIHETKNKKILLTVENGAYLIIRF
jgi:hypothetical protein